MSRSPRRVLALAAAFLIVAAALGAPVVGQLEARSSDFQDPAAASVRAATLIEDATGHAATFGVVALVRASGDVTRDPRARAKVARLAALLRASPGSLAVVDYVHGGLPALVSRDRRESLVLASFVARSASTAAVDRLRPRLAAHGVSFGGPDIAFAELDHDTSADLEHAELLAVPLLLALSFWVFRGLVAALLPPLVGLTAIVVALLGMRIVNGFSPLSIFALNLVTGMGLGLAIDYSLFIVSRFREELATGAPPADALTRTLRTAGRTVLFSALTVAGALASLLVFPIRFLSSMGVGGAFVSLASGAVALTVLPAVLVLLGPRVNSLAPAGLQRSRARGDRPADHGGWLRLGQAVMRRPGRIALVVTAGLVLAGLPALRLTLVPASALALPPGSPTREVAQALPRDFATDGSQAITLVATRRRDLRTIAAAAGRLAATPPTGPRAIGHGIYELDVLPRGDADAPANQALVRALRRLPGVTVGGATATFVDQKAAISAQLPLVLGLLAAVTLGALATMTGSVVLPLVALAMNVLTALVAAGLLVLIFQDGHLGGLLGFSSIGGLEESNLVLLFVVVFALSTDYGVFLLGRVREARASGRPSRQAVAFGLERTGRLITAAALLFCVAIGAFATSHVFFVKQLGVGAALAVALDATVVRALLVPALLGLLGDRAWWAPGPLRRLAAAADH